MTQYCRYCAHCVYGDWPWCEKKEMELSESYAKNPNKCRDWELNEIDAFGENPNPYRPRKEKFDDGGQQERMVLG